ncbi:MAG: hypothetical protein ACAI38_00055 [Myxococcota bacterium]
MFARVLEDERRHELYTRELLVRLSGGEAAAARALRASVRWELKRTWLRHGRALSNHLFTATMWLLYLVIAPFALVMRARAPRASGWR